MTHRFIFGALLVIAGAAATGAQPRPAHNLDFSEPAMVWDEAQPLGNGLLGALVWGDGHPLKISLDRTDLWDLRPVPEYESEDYSYERMRQWVKEGREKGTLSRIRYNKPRYSERYPELVNILEDEPAAPRGNRVFANVSFGGKWDGVRDEARKYQKMENNLVDHDPSRLLQRSE